MLETDHFVIIGKKLVGSNSLPSGHAITVFRTLTIILIAFMPQKGIEEIGMDIGFYHNLHVHFYNAGCGWGRLHIGCYDRRDYRLCFRRNRYYLQPKIQLMEMDIAKTV